MAGGYRLVDGRGGIGWLMGGGQVVGHADIALARCRSAGNYLVHA